MPEQTPAGTATPARRSPGKRTYRLVPKEKDRLLSTDITDADFPAFLRKLRLRAGISQEGLARLAGLTRQHISYLEIRHAATDRVATTRREVLLRISHILRLGVYERDALLFKAGKAPVVDWMVVAIRESPIQKEDYLRSVMDNKPESVSDAPGQEHTGE